MVTILEMEDIGDRGNILDVLNAEVRFENEEIIPANKDSRNIVDQIKVASSILGYQYSFSEFFIVSPQFHSITTSEKR